MLQSFIIPPSEAKMSLKRYWNLLGATQTFRHFKSLILCALHGSVCNSQSQKGMEALFTCDSTGELQCGWMKDYIFDFLTLHVQVHRK